MEKTTEDQHLEKMTEDQHIEKTTEGFYFQMNNVCAPGSLVPDLGRSQDLYKPTPSSCYDWKKSDGSGSGLYDARS